jgi:hypothetical protein
MRYWELIEESTERRDDGGRSGWWRITRSGSEFALGRSLIVRTAHVFDNEVLRYDGPEISIEEAGRFNLADLLSGRD